MNLHLRFLRQPEALREVLQKDGWRLETGKDESLFAHHPQVFDEPAARSRLYHLGVLTSSSLCIEFQRRPQGTRGRNSGRRGPQPP